MIPLNRKTPSLPARFLFKHDLLKDNILDYGCGKGFDANYYLMDKYDPVYFPSEPNKNYDTICCTYVLNILNKDEQLKVINKINNLLNVEGKAYLSVRRDLKKETKSQRLVYLYLKSIYKNSNFEIYLLTKKEHSYGKSIFL